MKIPDEARELAAMGVGVSCLALSSYLPPFVAGLLLPIGGALCGYAIILARRNARRETLEELTGKVFLFSASVRPADAPEHPAKSEEVAN